MAVGERFGDVPKWVVETLIPPAPFSHWEKGESDSPLSHSVGEGLGVRAKEGFGVRACTGETPVLRMERSLG